MSSSSHKRRRERKYSSSPSPERRRRRGRRGRSRSSSRDNSHSRRHSSSDSEHHKKSHRRRRYSSSDSGEDSDRYHRHGNRSKHGSRLHGHSSGSSRQSKRERHRSQSRSPSPRKDHHKKKRRERSHSGDRKRHRRHSASRSQSREKTESKEQVTEKSKESSEAKKAGAAENLRAKVKALLAKSAEGQATEADTASNFKAMPTPGQLSVIESNSFTADKFVSKRASKKWDVPPSDVARKTNKKSFDATSVDPSEYAPKVVPMCEVESVLEREGEGEVWDGEGGGRGVVLIKQNTEKSTSETEPIVVDKNQKWLQKLQKMRQRAGINPEN